MSIPQLRLSVKHILRGMPLQALCRKRHRTTARVPRPPTGSPSVLSYPPPCSIPLQAAFSTLNGALPVLFHRDKAAAIDGCGERLIGMLFPMPMDGGRPHRERACGQCHWIWLNISETPWKWGASAARHAPKNVPFSPPDLEGMPGQDARAFRPGDPSESPCAAGFWVLRRKTKERTHMA